MRETVNAGVFNAVGAFGMTDLAEYRPGKGVLDREHREFVVHPAVRGMAGLADDLVRH